MLESATRSQVRWLTWSVVAADLFLLLAGCTPTRPDPDEYEYHDHRLVLRTRSINQSADTSGVVTLRLPIVGTGYWRRSFSTAPLVSWNTSLPATLPIDVIRPDTEFTACSTTVRHYTGYQLKYGGDTTHLACLDNDTSWTMGLRFSQPVAQLLSGDSARLTTVFLYSVPDTARGQETIELDITFDLDGLILVESIPINTQLVTLRQEKIYYRQR